MIPEIEETPEEIHRVDDLTNEVSIEQPPVYKIPNNRDNQQDESPESELSEGSEENPQIKAATEPPRIDDPELQVLEVPERASDRQIPNRTPVNERPSRRAKLRE